MACVCHFLLSGGHANGSTVSLSYPVQYFGGVSLGMWQNRVYGKTLVRQPGLVSNPADPSALLLWRVTRSIASHARSRGDVSRRDSRSLSVGAMVFSRTRRHGLG